MVMVGKRIKGIMNNPLEYLLDDDGKVMEFISEDAARAFLKDKSFTDDNILLACL